MLTAGPVHVPLVLSSPPRSELTSKSVAPVETLRQLCDSRDDLIHEQTIMPNGGIYTNAQTVTITPPATSPGAVIYYAINGTPTTNSTRYAGPPTILSSETVSAIAALNGYINSSPVFVTYTINPPQPSVTLTTTARAVTLGTAVPLNWTVTNATSCSADSSDGSWRVPITPSTGAASVPPGGLNVQTLS